MLFYFRLGMRNFFFFIVWSGIFVFVYFVWDYSVFKGCSYGCDLGFPFFFDYDVFGL